MKTWYRIGVFDTACHFASLSGNPAYELRIAQDSLRPMLKYFHLLVSVGRRRLTRMRPSMPTPGVEISPAARMAAVPVSR